MNKNVISLYRNAELLSIGFAICWMLALAVFCPHTAIGQSQHSADGEIFQPFGEVFKARPGGWVGAKVGLFASRPFENYDSGFVDIDWFRRTEND